MIVLHHRSRLGDCRGQMLSRGAAAVYTFAPVECARWRLMPAGQIRSFNFTEKQCFD